MDSLEWNLNKREPVQKKCRQLTGRLEAARNKLTPIVDVILSSAVDLIQKGDNKFLNEATLTSEQFGDVIWASEVLKEIVYDFKVNPTTYRWPNTDVIVNNVSVDYKNRMNPDRDKYVVIDEVTIVHLLELYEQMGDVIQKITEDANKQNEEPTREKTTSTIKNATSAIKPEKSRTTSSSEKQIGTTSSSERPLRTTSSSERPARTTSSSSQKMDDLPPHIKSTLSVIQKSSSGELNKKHGVRYNGPTGNGNKGENTNVFIRIQCISDGSEGERDENFQTVSLPAECNKESTPHYHLKLGGEPVTLKVNQTSVEKGAIYCINTGTDSEENDVRIFIKQCPECLSTVVGSSSKIRDMPGESHESVTLHGKGLDDEEQMAYSTDDTTESYKEESHRGDSSRDFQQQSSHRSFREEGSSLHQIHKEPSHIDEPYRGESHRSVKSDKEAVALESTCGCGLETICIDISTSLCSCDKDGDGECRSKLRITQVPSHAIVTKNGDVIKGPSMVRDSSVRYPSVVRGPSMGDEHSLAPSMTHDRDGEKSTTKMDVLIDADNVDKSTVKFTGSRESPEHIPSLPQHTSSPISVDKPSVQTIHSKKESEVLRPPSKQKSLIPLMRRRICSSMEFDVTTVNTRLREHEMEHNNPQIVVELKQMGVDHLLRACRPAKCCRKAILDERQRTALPYCVSLRSLPLMGNDAEVIKQSYDMSVRKIKNALDLTQNQRDKLAYYVNLGRDDFRPTINFPWVIPVYDMKQSVKLDTQSKEKFYVLKKSGNPDLKPRKPKSMSSALKLLKDKQKQQKRLASNKQRKIRSKRYFVLKKLKEQEVPHNSSDTESQIASKKRCAKQNSRRKRKVRFKEPMKANGDKNYLDKIKEWNQSRGSFNRAMLKNIWGKDHGDQIVFFDSGSKKESCDFHSTLDDVLFNFKNYASNFHSRSESDVSSHYESFSRLLDFDFSSVDQNRRFRAERLQDFMGEAGDYPHVPVDEMIEVCLGQINGLNHNFQIAPKKSFSDTQLTDKGRSHLANTEPSNFWDHISEELFYTSSAVTIFMKRTRSVGRVPKTNNSRCKQISDEITSYATRLGAEKEHERPEVRKKLEYYVSLVNGDLIWGQSLPLKLQKYDAYYNYSDNASVRSPKGSRTTIRQGDRADGSNFSRRNTLDEIPPQDRRHIRQNNRDSRPIPVNSIESESPYKEWAPFLISEHSLPTVGVEEQIQKVQQAHVEAAKPKVNKECAKKQTCIENKCKVCTGKVCERPKRKCHGQGNIVIGIQKTKSKCNTVCVKKAVEKSCSKEVCEIYKNKMLVSENNGKSSKEPCDPCDNKTLTIKGKDNIKIVIKDKKISVVNDNKKPGKKSKEKER